MDKLAKGNHFIRARNVRVFRHLFAIAMCVYVNIVNKKNIVLLNRTFTPALCWISWNGLCTKSQFTFCSLYTHRNTPRLICIPKISVLFWLTLYIFPFINHAAFPKVNLTLSSGIWTALKMHATDIWKYCESDYGVFSL